MAAKSGSDRRLEPALGAIALLLAGSGQAVADQVGEAASQLDEVVVTALKRAESVQSIPVAVTALPAAVLENANLENTAGLTGLVPSLQVNGVAGDTIPLYSLRGVSMFDYSFNQSSPVASYFDEVYKGNFAILGLELYDLERIEVLRGPQGTLYGKNTTGGAINFIAVKPSFEPGGFLRAGIGNYNRREIEGAIGGALLPDRLAARLAFTWAEADGWFRNVLPGEPDLDSVDQWAVRTQLLYQATDSLRLNLRFAASRQNPQNYGIIGRPGDAGVGFDPGYFRTVDGTATGTPLRDDQLATDETRKRVHDTESWVLTAVLEAGDSFDITSITSYDDGKLFSPEASDGSPVNVLRAIYYGETEQFTQDLRLTSKLAGPLQFIIGGFYQHEKIFNETEVQFYNGWDPVGDGAVCLETGFFGCSVANEFDQIRDSWAIYGDASYALNDRVKLRGGLRYSRDEGDLRNFVSRLTAPNGTPLANLIPGDPDDMDATLARSISDSAISGRIGIDFAPSEDTLLYLAYSRGYRSGAFNAQAFFSAEEVTTVEPEKLDLLEAGFKTQWLDQRLQVNGALFRYEYKDQQIVDIDPVTVVQRLLNLGKARTTGAEIEALARPVPALRLRAAVSWLHARFVDAVVLGATIDGNRLPNAPDFSANLGLDWDLWSAERAIVSLHLDGNYQTSQYFEVLNIDRLEQSGYGIVNGRIAIRSPADHWEVGIWGRNLTDKMFITSAVNFLDGFGFDYLHRNAPRTYGVDVRFSF
ncbi:MAG: TonB-dependent receptor [Gammaproteobacteria bacterium]|nr:TonB-dependent receptor [Gammaproteobacteria bacterium]